jgi:hypothetical protein
MQRLPKRAVVPEIRIPEHGRDVKTSRANLPQQRERQTPFFVEPNGGGNSGAFACLGRQPLGGQIQRRAQHPRPNPCPQRGGHGDLAVGHLAQRPAILPRHGHRAAPLLGKTRRVEYQHAAPFGNDRAQLSPDAFGTPRGVRDEVLERLVRPRIADALEHGAHRLPAAVAQQAEQVPPEGAPLRDVREADLERLKPFAQAIEPRRRVARQSRQHRKAAYRSRRRSTRPLLQFCSDLRTNRRI